MNTEYLSTALVEIISPKWHARTALSIPLNQVKHTKFECLTKRNAYNFP